MHEHHVTDQGHGRLVAKRGLRGRAPHQVGTRPRAHALVPGLRHAQQRAGARHRDRGVLPVQRGAQRLFACVLVGVELPACPSECAVPRRGRRTPAAVRRLPTPPRPGAAPIATRAPVPCPDGGSPTAARGPACAPHAAANMGISRQCASKWDDRRRKHGKTGSAGPSNVPHHQPTATGLSRTIHRTVDHKAQASQRGPTRYLSPFRATRRDCSKIGVSGPTRRAEVRWDGHCE